MDFCKLARRFEGTLPEAPIDSVERRVYWEMLRTVRSTLQGLMGERRKLSPKVCVLIGHTVDGVYQQWMRDLSLYANRKRDIAALDAHREQILKLVFQAAEESRAPKNRTNGYHGNGSTKKPR